MKSTAYKLDEFKIIESDTGELVWEAHFGLGELREGRCFRKGGILFIGPAENYRPGFLKREFLDHLKPLPAWPKTEFYCNGFDVYHCSTGKGVTKAEMRMWTLERSDGKGNRPYPEQPGKGSNHIPPGRVKGDVSFRLQGYEIIRRSDGRIVWKTQAGPNSTRVGACVDEEDILFIGPQRGEQSGLVKQHFLSNLRQLPKWDQTRYYSLRLSLRDCRTVRGGPAIQRKRWSMGKGAQAIQYAGKRLKDGAGFRPAPSDPSEKDAPFLAGLTIKCITCSILFIVRIISFLYHCLIRRYRKCRL